MSRYTAPLIGRTAANGGQEQPIPIEPGSFDQDLQSTGADNKTELWSPVILVRKFVWWTLATISILILLLVITHSISTRYGGLIAVDTRNHYLWRYGPTITFVALSTLWGQVEVRILQLLPWCLASPKSISASDDVELDYATIRNVSAFFRSVKRHHLGVPAVAAVLMIVKLTIVLSTSLFSINLVNITTGAEFTLQAEFDGSNFNPTVIDATAFMRSWGVLRHGLSHPPGTSDNHAFQLFCPRHGNQDGLPIYTSGQQYTADVDVFTPWLECREAVAITDRSTTDVTLQSANCAYRSTSSSNQFWPQEVIFALAPCNANNMGDADNRIWVSLAMRTESGNGQEVAEWEQQDGTTSGVLHMDFVALMCIPHYNVSRGLVSLKATSDSRHPLPIVTKSAQGTRLIPDVTASDLLAAGYRSVARAADAITWNNERWQLLGIDPSTVSTIFARHLLEQRVSQNVNGILVQIANQYLTQQTTGTANGTVASTESRLVVRGSTAFVVAMLLSVAAALLLVFLFLDLPITAPSKDVRSTSELHTILSSSRPSSTSSFLYITIVFLPAVIICMLEVLPLTPVAAHEPGNASNIAFAGASTSLMLPLTLLGVQSLFEVVHLRARIFERYNEPETERGSLAKSIRDKHDHRNLITARLWTALLKRQGVVVASAVAAILWLVSAIVAASLFTVSPMTMKHEVSVTQINQLNISQGGLLSARVEEDAWLGDLILEFDAPYPTWTYQEWSFPQIEIAQQDVGTLDALQGNTASGETSITVRLPAVRIDMGCERLSSNMVRVTVGSLPTIDMRAMDSHDADSESLPDLERSECGYGDSDIKIPYPGPSSYFEGWAISPDVYSTVDELSPNACPAFVGIFGRTAPGPPALSNLNFIECRPQIKQRDFNVNLWLPDYRFNPNVSPVPVPGTTVVLWDKFWDSTNMRMRTWGSSEWKEMSPALVLSGLQDVEKYFIDIDVNDPSTQNLRRPLRSVIHGVNATAAEALLDVDVLISSLNRNVGILTAQLISKFGREKSPDNNATVRELRPTYPATLNIRSMPREIQQRLLTRVYQSILAALSLWGLWGVTSVLVDGTRTVLPKHSLRMATKTSSPAVPETEPSRGQEQASVTTIDSEERNGKGLKRRDVSARQA